MTQLNILVAEEPGDEQEIITRALTATGCRPVVCSSAAEIIEHLTLDWQLDAAFLGNSLSGPVALGVLKTLRKKRSLFEFPVVVSPSVIVGADLSKALAVGANDYIERPLCEDVLRARMLTIVRACTFYRRLKHLLDSNTATATAQTPRDLLSIVGIMAASECKLENFELIGQEFLFGTHFYHQVVLNPFREQGDLSAFSLYSLSVSPDYLASNEPQPFETTLEKNAIKIPLMVKGKKPCGFVCLKFSTELIYDEHLKFFLDALGHNAAVRLENLYSIYQTLLTEKNTYREKMELLGVLAIRLGDRINTPLEMLQLVSEEIKDIANEPVPHQDMNKEMNILIKKIDKSIANINQELIYLRKFRAFLPSMLSDEVLSSSNPEEILNKIIGSSK